MRVAVTGASGFVGGAVLDLLLARGHDVLALSRRPVAARPGLQHRHWDLASGALPDAPTVDVVVHAAAHVDEWDPWAVHEAVTVSGTRAVLSTWPTARVVLVSSCSVYPLRAPRPPRQVLTEDIAPARRHLSAYSRAKAAQERLVLEGARNVVLRPHAVHGSGDPTLLPRLARARRRGRLVCPGGPDTLVHLTDVRLVAEAAVAACEIPCDASVLNVVDAEPLRLATVATGLATANGWDERPLFTGAPAAWAAALALEGTARLVRASTHRCSRHTPSRTSRWAGSSTRPGCAGSSGSSPARPTSPLAPPPRSRPAGTHTRDILVTQHTHRTGAEPE